MPLHRDITDLLPVVQVKIKKFLKALDDKGIKYYINETYREQIVQDAYYAQGRESLIIVNNLRKKAGLYLLDESENANIVTNAKVSNHTARRAIDITPSDDGKTPLWNAPSARWKTIADIAVENGLVAGYYWTKFPDLPHIEVPAEVKDA